MSEMLEFENASALDIALSEKVAGLLSRLHRERSGERLVGGLRWPHADGVFPSAVAAGIWTGRKVTVSCWPTSAG